MAVDRALEQIGGFGADLITLRHEIHRRPEVGYEEFHTAALVARELKQLGIAVTENVAGTGVVGSLAGKRLSRRAIGLRADLDALHVSEQSKAAYASQVPGKMHACGHDGHTAMLLGAARYLAANPDFAGTVHFIFQPAEEGLGGGRRMVEEGLFDRFPVDAVYGMHNLPGLAAGSFAIRPGPMMAASDRWSVTIRGTGGHGGADVHRISDPSIPLAQLILGIQTIVSRKVPANDTAVVSIGHISGGDAKSPNVVPAEYVVHCTARSYSPAVRDTIERTLCQLAEGIATAHGCTALVEYDRRYPPLVNAVEQTRIAAAAASVLVTPEKVNTEMTPSTAAEDFSFILQAKPGAFIWIGNGVRADGGAHGLHSPLYDFNDDILALGAAYWVSLVDQELSDTAD